MNLNATIFGQIIAFFVFAWFCKNYVWPPIVAALDERQKKIADGLEAADRAGKDLELAQEKASQLLKEAKKDSVSILDQANKRASQIVDEAKEQARLEGQRLITAAQAEIEQEVLRAKEDLRAQVSALAISGAEKILQSSVDEKVHASMLDQLATSLR
ncbi:MAG: F0F1 ATP synthase subunit B [Gammaproteobacteria bacterium]|nr:F0F1 ATP synthase subunit B [Gammaproteobacteria bacterium]